MCVCERERKRKGDTSSELDGREIKKQNKREKERDRER